ncbi:MAG: hypothetical protein M1832_005373 [Thelocarpon impressellum]|nr:MAG: hypothetical protein M1832_005373 [Thelocarpon impressellum]
MFRSPQDITSSDSDLSTEGEPLVGDGEGQRTAADGPKVDAEDGLGRDQGPEVAGSSASGMIPEQDAAGHSNFIYHTLLEQFCVTRALKKLNSEDPASCRYSETDPEVVALGRAFYAQLSVQLGQHGMIGSGYEGDALQGIRSGYLQGLDYMLEKAMDEAAPAIDGVTTVSTATASGGAGHQPLLSSGPESRPVLAARVAIPETQAPLSGALVDMYLGSSPPGIPAGPLVRLSPTSGLSKDLSMPASRYASDFRELGFLGQGGYGRVYQVVNHLDGQHYAVKKITLSPKRLKKLQDGGMNELEALLREIRTLASLEHHNVVRYYSGWVEQTLDAAREARRLFTSPPRRARPDLAGIKETLEDEHQDVDFAEELVAEDEDGILFAFSADMDRQSRGEVGNSIGPGTAAVSSTLNKQSFAKSLGEDDDDDVELIQRDFGPISAGRTTTDTYSSNGVFSDEFSEQAESRIAKQHSEPTMTLHIQMSLHPLSLSKYLFPDVCADKAKQEPALRHCYHVEPSLRLMLAILSGVEYLHGQNVIHRDLKPGNIFLATHDEAPASAGCVNLRSCRQCDPQQKRCKYIVPRIGDFGLVAKIAPNEEPSTRPVGTTFYRPAFSSKLIDGKLDVFALGIVLFETLCKFETST